jgi:hypothetical protein
MLFFLLTVPSPLTVPSTMAAAACGVDVSSAPARPAAAAAGVVGSWVSALLLFAAVALMLLLLLCCQLQHVAALLPLLTTVLHWAAWEELQEHAGAQLLARRTC